MRIAKRNAGRLRHFVHTRQSGEPIVQLSLKRSGALRSVPRTGKVKHHRLCVFHLKTGIDRLRAIEAVQEKS